MLHVILQKTSFFDNDEEFRIEKLEKNWSGSESEPDLNPSGTFPYPIGSAALSGSLPGYVTKAFHIATSSGIFQPSSCLQVAFVNEQFLFKSQDN